MIEFVLEHKLDCAQAQDFVLEHKLDCAWAQSLCSSTKYLCSSRKTNFQPLWYTIQQWGVHYLNLSLTHRASFLARNQFRSVHSSTNFSFLAWNRFQRLRSETVGFAKPSKRAPEVVSIVSLIRHCHLPYHKAWLAKGVSWCCLKKIIRGFEISFGIKM